MTTPEDEHKDPVWDLLNESRPAKPSPMFSRNVVREVRNLDSDSDLSLIATLSRWFRRPFVLNSALTGAVAAGIVILFFVVWDTPNQEKTGQGTPTSVAQVAEKDESMAVDSPADDFDPANEIENLDYLGELMAVTDPAILDDSAFADLLF